MKNLRVDKTVNEITFEWVWGELEAKNCSQAKSFTQYLRLALVFMGNRALQKKSNFCFLTVFFWQYLQNFHLGRKT